jgi:hypothetical protein
MMFKTGPGGGGTSNFTALNFPKQHPLVLLVRYTEGMVVWRHAYDSDY